LSGIAAGVVITCEFEPLRDEGEADGERLRQAGVPVRVSRYEGMILDGRLTRRIGASARLPSC
jgi:acetyl esterase